MSYNTYKCIFPEIMEVCVLCLVDHACSHKPAGDKPTIMNPCKSKASFTAVLYLVFSEYRVSNNVWWWRWWRPIAPPTPETGVASPFNSPNKSARGSRHLGVG